MKSEDVRTVGDLIAFLIQFDTSKQVMIYDYEWDIEKPLQHIDVENDRVVFYN